MGSPSNRPSLINSYSAMCLVNHMVKPVISHDFTKAHTTKDQETGKSYYNVVMAFKTGEF